MVELGLSLNVLRTNGLELDSKEEKKEKEESRVPVGHVLKGLKV